MQVLNKLSGTEDQLAGYKLKDLQIEKNLEWKIIL
jgi:hypothetical protein